MDEFLLELQAKLDEAKSKGLINADIEKIQQQIDKLKLQAEIDPKSISNLVKQLESVLNQKITISNIGINQQQAIKSGQQTGEQIGNAINQSINKVIQKGNFKKVFVPTDNFNNAAKDAENYFKTLSSTVSVQEQLGKNNNLEAFTVSLKNAEGVVEQLRYKYRELADDAGNVTDRWFEYSGGSINDNGVIKQMNAISAKADSLQTKLEKLKSSYSDINASRPIKDSNNISALSQQYDKVSQSIENVRSADNSTFSSMVSNAQKEITVLESMVSQFRNAENVATQMKSVDISSGIAQAQERLGKLKANSSGFEQMTQTLKELDVAIENVGDKSSLDAFIDKLRVAEAQLSRVKAEVKSTAQIDKIQLSLDTGEYESKVDNLIARTKQWTDENGNARISTANLEKALNELDVAYDNLAKNGTVENQQALIEKEKQLETQVKSVTSEVRTMNAQLAKSSAIDSLYNQVNDFISKNGKTMKYFGTELKDIFNQTANGAKLTKTELSELKQKFIDVQNEARQTGKLGKTWFQSFKEGIPTFTSWISASGLVMKAINSTRQAISFTTELNSALTNINYTMDVTADQLEKIGQKSISMAKDLNTSAENVLGAVKLYANAKETANTILQKAQPAIMLSNVAGFTGEQSAKYLQTIMNQFDLTQDELLNISDIIQAVSQNMAHDFSDGIIQINEGIETSGEVARAAGMDLAEYASMIGLLVEKTGLQGSQLGNAVKTIITRTTKAGKILGIDEGEISDAEKSLKNVGIAVRETDGEFREFKDTMRDLSEVWDDLSDVEKSNIAFNLAGTRQINVIQTLLRNWSDYEDLVVKANESAGVSFENQEKYAESLEGKMKGLSATMTSVKENLINEDSVSPVVDMLSKLADGLDKVTGKLGLLGTLGAGAGLFAGWKNVGGGENAPSHCFELPTIICVL